MSGYPDVEDALTLLLAPLASDPDNTGTETPSDLQDRLNADNYAGSFIRVGRFGGPDDGITDAGRYDVDVFAARRSVAVAVAEDVRQFLTAGPHVVGDVLLDEAVTNSGPSPAPWDDPTVRRRTASYTIAARRIHVA